MKTAKQIADEYRSFITDTGGVCWKCARTAYDRPRWWFAEWQLHPHHIVAKPRKRDRRACIVLCPACHSVQHDGHYAAYDLTDGGKFPDCTAQKMTIEETIKLKRDRDPSFFDPEFLASCAIKRELVLRICRELEQ